MCCLRVIIIIFWISTLVNSGGFSSIDWSIRLHLHHHVSVQGVLSAADSSSAGSIATTINTTAAPVAIPTAANATTTTTTTTGVGGGVVARSSSQNKVLNNRDLCRIIFIYMPERTGRLN